MTQNIFDNPDFFSRYFKLRLNPEGHNELIEKPAFLTLLPNLEGSNVLDLGCGHGDLCRHVVAYGAAKATGLDISSKMLEFAKTYETNNSCINYILQDMSDISIQEEMFDLVISSLAIHYVEDYSGIVNTIRKLLKPNGFFIFSVEHPVYTAPKSGPSKSWERDAGDYYKNWKLDAYANEGKRIVDWLVPGVEKYHRKLETYIMALITNHFIINIVLEPNPTRDALKKNPSLDYEMKRPLYLMVSAKKSCSD